MREEFWCGYRIRFIEKDGEWWAILKDVCDALNLRTAKVVERLHPEMMMRVPVERTCLMPANYVKKDEVLSKDVNFYTEKDDHPSKGVNFSDKYKTFNKTVHMLAVNELGIYEALFASRKLEARKFRMWSAEVMRKLRRYVGLKGYEVMKMTEPEIQDEIDFILDTIFYDEERGGLMRSVTVQGGDVEQVPFDPQEVR